MSVIQSEYFSFFKLDLKEEFLYIQVQEMIKQFGSNNLVFKYTKM